MNSFRTHDDTLAALAPYGDLPVAGLDLGFVQNQEPKLRADDLTPISWPLIRAWNGAHLGTVISTPHSPRMGNAGSPFVVGIPLCVGVEF